MIKSLTQSEDSIEQGSPVFRRCVRYCQQQIHTHTLTNIHTGTHTQTLTHTHTDNHTHTHTHTHTHKRGLNTGGELLSLLYILTNHCISLNRERPSSSPPPQPKKKKKKRQERKQEQKMAKQKMPVEYTEIHESTCTTIKRRNCTDEETEKSLIRAMSNTISNSKTHWCRHRSYEN